jgi:predicted O-methyltransferase YrrM
MAPRIPTEHHSDLVEHARRWAGHILGGDLAWQIKTRTGGMLRTYVYRRIYEALRAEPDMDFVEIGIAAGSASIAIAKAMADAGMQSKLIAAEKLTADEQNRVEKHGLSEELLRQNFAAFGVDRRIDLFLDQLRHDNASQLLEKLKTPQISGMMHDADGQIQRDLHILGSRLRPNALIIIDDYEDSNDHSKKQTTFRMVNRLIDQGLLAPQKIVHNTLFARWPADADPSRIDFNECFEIVQQVRREFGLTPLEYSGDKLEGFPAN